MNTKNLRRNSRKCMRYIVVLFCKLLCVTCCSMKRGRIRRLEPGKIGGGRGTGGRSSKRVGGGISPGETAQQCSIFCNWIGVREPGMQGKEAGGLEPLPSMFKYPCVDFITGIYGKTPKFILPRTVTRGHQQGWTRQIWGTRKPDFRSDQICFAFVCVHTLASTAGFNVIFTRDFNYPSFFVQVLSDQHQFSQNFHLRENALIFSQILPTNSFEKCMEISLENFCVDIVA